jgi:hypothetical protein
LKKKKKSAEAATIGWRFVETIIFKPHVPQDFFNQMEYEFEWRNLRNSGAQRFQQITFETWLN